MEIGKIIDLQSMINNIYSKIDYIKDLTNNKIEFTLEYGSLGYATLRQYNDGVLVGAYYDSLDCINQKLHGFKSAFLELKLNKDLIDAILK